MVGEELGAMGDMRVECTGVLVRKDVWGTRAPAGGKRQKGGTNMIEVVGAHKAHQVVYGIVGFVVEEVCVCVCVWCWVISIGTGEGFVSGSGG